jgi:hypothetical protein
MMLRAGVYKVRCGACRGGVIEVLMRTRERHSGAGGNDEGFEYPASDGQQMQLGCSKLSPLNQVRLAQTSPIMQAKDSSS